MQAGCARAWPQAPVMRGHTDTITALVVLSDGRVASGGLDSQLCLWDASGGTCEVLTPAGGKITGLTALSEARPPPLPTAPLLQLRRCPPGDALDRGSSGEMKPGAGPRHCPAAPPCPPGGS